MALINKSTTNRAYLSPAQVAEYTSGAVSYQFLKRDRAESEANGTPPQIPYYKIGYRTLKYRPADVDAFLASQRVG